VTYVQGPVLTKTLQLASTDPEVVALQQFLVAKGLLTLPSTIPMGYFGGLTEQAVKKFQTGAGLDPIGIVGPLTRNAIAATTITKYATSGIPAGFFFTRPLKIGSTGTDVAALQQILITNGFLVFNAKSNPGYFGGVTRAALMKFQKSIGLAPVGSVGPATRRALNALTSQ
jgi:peptidoglycan hydrolase-like protein with peptidoglycan-binding domain